MFELVALEIISCRIIASQLTDSGVYICMARNSLGSILVSANLTVQGKIKLP